MEAQATSNMTNNSLNSIWNNSQKLDERLESLCYGAECTGEWSMNVAQDYEAFPILQTSPKRNLFISVADVIDSKEYQSIDVFWTMPNPEHIILESDSASLYGYIYLATNNINGYQYIGQTKNNIPTRWREHLRDSKHKKCTRFDQAISEFGAENFTVVTIDFACSPIELNRKERYWIAKYDVCLLLGSTHGYNWQLGGYGSLVEINEEYVCQLYLSGHSIDEIAYILGLETSNSIRSVIKKHNILRPRTNFKNHYVAPRANAIWVVQFDSNRYILNTFVSYRAAGRWILDQNLSDATLLDHVVTGIRHACEEQRAGYGYYWCAGATKEEAIQAVNDFPIPNNEPLRPYIPWSLREDNVCAYEGCNRIIEPRAQYCFEHIKVMQRRFDDDLNTIVAMVTEYGYEATGRYYNVSGNAIKKRLRLANIPSKKSDLVLYAYQQGICQLPFSKEAVADILDRIESGISYDNLKRHMPELNLNMYRYLCTQVQITDSELVERQQAYLNQFKRRRVEQWTADGNRLVAVFDNTTDAANSLSSAKNYHAAITGIARSCTTGVPSYGYCWKWTT